MTNAKEIPLQSVFWSLTAALTPGNHHVRLYLETEGKITTLLSKRDDFTSFYTPDWCGPRGPCTPPSGESMDGEPNTAGCGTGSACTQASTPSQGGAAPEGECGTPRTDCPTDLGPIVFKDKRGNVLTNIFPRDPNVSVSDEGVYVMTWDNRRATSDYGPGGKYDSTALSDTFGLAFSSDGLNWTVVSNELRIQSAPKEPMASTDTPQFVSDPTGRLRHVVPIFLTPDQLRLYFTSEIGYSCNQLPSIEYPSACPGEDSGRNCGSGSATSK